MAGASLLLGGCIARTVELPAPPPPVTGVITATPGRPGEVVAAPHASSDLHTGEIATAIARRTGFGLVVATGFAVPADPTNGPGRRYEVNRPFEGVPGRPPAEEVATESARRVYALYEQRVREAAGGPLRLLVEIHGNERPDTANRIDIATVGVDAEFAHRLRVLAELIREAHLRRSREAPRLGIVVEPEARVVYAASGAKRDGILRLPARALHIELPRAARTRWREVYTAILADFVAQAATLPVGR